MKLKTVLFDETAVRRALIRISHEIVEKNKGSENLVFIGIKTRGVPMANDIAKNIESFEGKAQMVGSLDITLFRDDLSILQAMPEVKGSEIDFDVTGKDVILCDDVLHTGRTVRAAIEAIMKLGRPKTIQLAVLIDRGHRELPIRPDYVGKNVPTALEESIEVSFDSVDGITAVSLYSKE